MQIEMETKKLSTGKAALIYGIILGVISVAFSVILYFMDLAYERNWASSLVSIIMIIILVIIGIVQFKISNSGYITIMESLKVGIGVALIGSILSILYLFILTTVIEPGFWEKSIEMAKPAMQEQYPRMTAEQIDQMIATQKKYYWLTYPTIVIFNLFIGFVVSLITGLIVKKSEDTN
jgi:hypothetical protein